MKTSPIGQTVIILVLSFLFGFGYNAIRGDGLPLVAVKEIVRSDDVSDLDSLLAETTFFTSPMMIDLELAKQLYDRGVVFVDARDQEEFRQGHIAGAVSMTIIELVSKLSRDDPIVAYCSGEGCRLSMDLAETLMLDWEFTKVFVFDVGWPEWKAAGYGVEEGE